MALAIIVRQLMLRLYFTGLTKESLVDNAQVLYPLDQVHFEYYLLAGIIVGCFISYLSLREKRM
jgi:hypothetical protein